MFANLRPMFANLRLSVVAIACLVAGRVLIVRHDSGLPSFETLEKMMGGFAWKTERQFTRSGEAEDPVSGARDHRRKYLAWFRRSADLQTLIRRDGSLSIWPDNQVNGRVWRIEHDGRIVVLYDDLREAVVANRRSDMGLGIRPVDRRIFRWPGSFITWLWCGNRATLQNNSVRGTRNRTWMHPMKFFPPRSHPKDGDA